MDPSKVILRIILDVLSILIVFLPLLVLKAGISPYNRGFFCDDSSLRYPYRRSTVPGLYMEIVVCILPPLIFLITDLLKWKLVKSDEVLKIRGFHLPKALLSWYSITTVYFFGLGLEQSITNIGKFSIGRLRPHFIDVANPNITSALCRDALGYSRYVTETDIFLGSDAHRIKEARLSFPSGHASMSTYAALFTIIYLQVRMRWKDGSQLTCHVIQALLAFAAIYTSLSRVSDYKHHWSDVVAGAAVGVSVASLTAIHLSNLYKRQQISFLLNRLNQLTMGDKELNLNNTSFSCSSPRDVELQQPLEANMNQNNSHLTAPLPEPTRVSTGSYYDNRDVNFRCSDHSSHCSSDVKY